jgi:hypothetical protein
MPDRREVKGDGRWVVGEVSQALLREVWLCLGGCRLERACLDLRVPSLVSARGRFPRYRGDNRPGSCARSGGGAQLVDESPLEIVVFLSSVKRHAGTLAMKEAEWTLLTQRIKQTSRLQASSQRGAAWPRCN